MSDKSELHRLFEKMDEALPPREGLATWTVEIDRQRAQPLAWRVRWGTGHPQPPCAFTPEGALRSALQALLSYRGKDEADAERDARKYRDEIARLRRLIETP